MTNFIWTSYHSKDIPSRYNIKEDEHIKLFCTTDNVEGENINYLNEYLGELCTMYYVWKHNIKSDYVGFQHYRTLLRNIHTNKDLLIENGWPYKINELFYMGGIQSHIVYSSIQYLDSKYRISMGLPTNEIIDKYLLRNTLVFSCNMFVCKWEIFTDLCETIFGFLDYLFPNKTWGDINTLSTYIENSVKLFNDTKRKDDDHWYWATNYPYNKRYLIYFYEYFIPLYLNLRYNQSYDGVSYSAWNIDNNNLLRQYKVIVCDFENKDISLEHFHKWYELNNCTGAFKYFILNYKNSKVYDKYLENNGLFYGQYKYVEFTDNLDKNINDYYEKYNWHFEIYKIGINEYIDTIAYKFYNNEKYEIKQI